MKTSNGGLESFAGTPMQTARYDDYKYQFLYLMERPISHFSFA
jgi:hypothetical protein